MLRRSAPCGRPAAAGGRVRRICLRAALPARQELRGGGCLRHLSPRTEEAYVSWIRRFILFHGKRHPADLGPAEIAAFLTWLAERRRVSASTQNQALQAVLFPYRQVLRVEPGVVEVRKS